MITTLPSGQEIRLRRAQTLRAKGRSDEAMAEFRRAMELEPASEVIRAMAEEAASAEVPPMPAPEPRYTAGTPRPQSTASAVALTPAGSGPVASDQVDASTVRISRAPDEVSRVANATVADPGCASITEM